MRLINFLILFCFRSVNSTRISTDRDSTAIYDSQNTLQKRHPGIMTTPSPGRIEMGRMEVITGPMFSGKSEELIRRLKRARIARQRVACFKPDIDLRYHRTAIASHSSHTHDASTIGNTEDLRAALFPQLDQVEVVGIDE